MKNYYNLIRLLLLMLFTSKFQMILLKSIYHTLKIKLHLVFASFFFLEENQVKLARTKLSERSFLWTPGGKMHIFAILYVHNWEDVLIKQLKQMGHVEHFSWEGIFDFFRSKTEWQNHLSDTNDRLKAQFDKFYTEDVNILVFIYASDFSISAETIAYLKRKNVLVVSFCWDDLLYFQGKVRGQAIGIKNISRLADINLTMSPESFPLYHKNRAPYFFWESVALDCTSNKLDSLTLSVSEDFYVLFIGSKYGWREQFIEKLKYNGVEVRCFGSGWGTRSLTNEEMVNEIRKAPITLGFSNIGYSKNITTIKGRDFEVPLWGGLYLTQWSEGLRYYYEPGRDILVYKTFAECLEQIRFAQTHKKEVINIRKAGFIKAQKFATWDSRFKFLENLLVNATKRDEND